MRILITGNMGYVGPVVTRFLRENLVDAELIGFDTAYFAHSLTGASLLPEAFLDRQVSGKGRLIGDGYGIDIRRREFGRPAEAALVSALREGVQDVMSPPASLSGHHGVECVTPLGRFLRIRVFAKNPIHTMPLGLRNLIVHSRASIS